MVSVVRIRLVGLEWLLGLSMRRRTASRRGANRWRSIAVLLVIAISAISIAGYVALSITANGPPPSAGFIGWAALIQPASEPLTDQSQLQITSDAQGDDPFITYDVSACGPHGPYTAYLLLGGDAQISKMSTFPSFGPPLRPKELSNMEVISEVDTNTETASLGNVQLAQVNITNITVCQGVSNRAIPSNMLSPYAFDVQISGTLSKPLQQSWSGLWGLWHGPHAIQSWPLAGGVAAIPVGLNNFTVAGLRGQWSQPKSEYVQINGFDSDAWSVDTSTPTPSVSDEPIWSSMTPISPVAQITDTPSLALLQDWIVVCAIGLGIGGGLLASLLLDWIRPQPVPSTSKQQDSMLLSTPLRVPQQAQGTSRGLLAQLSPGLVAIGAVFILGYGRRRYRSRKR